VPEGGLRRPPPGTWTANGGGTAQAPVSVASSPDGPRNRHGYDVNERTDVVRGADGIARCWWGTSDPLYLAYHDEEWGRALRGDDALFEMLALEGFQAGLSWLTILRKRDAFRAAFAGFRIEGVAGFGEADVERLLADAGIVRNRAKIEATIANARAALELGPGGLTDLLWSYAPEPRPRRLESFADIPAKTPESEALSKELRRRGFRFVGPTIIYAFMQAVGMVDDHLDGCEIGVS
jgi:DNA-3-methyladenine glycosylase I